MRKGDLRKQQIMATAEKMFLQLGFERCAVQDIIDALRISKGGFYHHFETKYALLEAICRERIRFTLEKRLAAFPEDASPVNRINLLYGITGLFSIDDPLFTAMLINAAMKPEGAQLRYAMLETGREQVLPLLEKAVSDGKDNGELFPVLPVAAAAGVVYLLGNSMFEEIAKDIAEDVPSAMDKAAEILGTYRRTAEVVLGAPYRSIELADLRRIVQIARILKEDPRLRY
ncbi:MAG: TetR/AcrR family transcriptional regulator [Christensenellales bacterium]|jgi:AcrR family transcriptional regulator